MSNSKILLVYAGPWYRSYSDYECSQIANNSGANEFLILSAYGFNYCQPNDYILTESYVRSTTDVPNSVFGTTDASSIATIRQGMVDSINNYNAQNTYQFNLATYVSNVVALAERLIAYNSACKIWFGFPPIIDGCLPAAIRYNYYYNQNILYPIRTQMINNGHWGNVEGFYYGTESITQWYTKFNTSAINNQFDNVVVKNMKDLSDNVHSVGKKMLWIPYYRDVSGYEDVMRDGYVINKTNIFDKAILQPSYYFTPDVGTANLTLINNCITSQACKYANGSIVGGSKTSSAEIGAEMEIDDCIITGGSAGTAQDYLNRYNSYVSTFSSRVGSRPLAFYAGGPDSLLNSTVLNEVSAFF